jgi:hypothetical protein
MEELPSKASIKNLPSTTISEKELQDMVDRSGLKNEKEKEELLQFLRKNRQVFCRKLETPGQTKVQHWVKLYDETPIYKKPYRMSPKSHEIIEQAIQDMRQGNVISSPWAFPVVLIPKKDGTTRFCIDYRTLN